MSRGIQLKRLTGADLGLLGLPETLGDSPTERADRPSTGAEAPFMRERPPAGPPANPRYPSEEEQDTSADADGETERMEAEFVALTREIRLGLEETLGILNKTAGDPGYPE